MKAFFRELISQSPKKMISFADFINDALYHPEMGYYMKNNVKIGKSGDFITSSNISSVFGMMFARWYVEFAKKNMLSPAICEIGAGNGRFAKAFLEEWKKSTDESISYFIVEASPFHRSLQKELLKPYFEVNQLNSLEELIDFEGMVFSNELFDALPVHVIEKENGSLKEVMVGVSEGELAETKVPLTNSEILLFLNESKLSLTEGQRIEIPLAMEKMVCTIATRLKKGIVMSIDYGYTNEEWSNPSRRKGSLRGYREHQLVDNVLENPGEMDITSHIHFDWLIDRGEKYGLQPVFKLKQDEFLLKAGILKELEEHFDPNPFSETSKRNRAIRSLIMPSGMSSSFDILLQQKGMNASLENCFNT
ncbi:MAG: SAM-dependent methyltransferase [Bacillota bacterium]|nr:SAM-dependent methyltransferase [Bacillota bacterium]